MAIAVNEIAQGSRSESTRVSVREAQFSDYPAILELMQAYGMETKTREEWEHLWKSNPVYKQRRGWPIGWALLDPEGKLVGSCGNIPVAYELNGASLIAAVTHGWVVAPEYRNRFLLLASKYFAQKGADFLLNTTAIHEVGLIFRAFHAKPLPVKGLDSALFWITDHRGFARSVLTRKGIPLGSALSLPLALASAIRAWSRPRGYRSNRSRNISVAKKFDSRFDVFWQHLRDQSNILQAVRDRATLEWHYRHSLLAGKLWIFVHEDGQDIRSYALFQREDKPEVGLTRVRLVDFQSLEPAPQILDSMIAAALERCRACGVQMLESLAFAGEARRELEQSAPFRRTLSSWLFYYKPIDKGLKCALENPEIWQPSGYDGDSSL